MKETETAAEAAAGETPAAEAAAAEETAKEEIVSGLVADIDLVCSLKIRRRRRKRLRRRRSSLAVVSRHVLANFSRRSQRLRSLLPPRSTRTHLRLMSLPPLLLSRTPRQRHLPPKPQLRHPPSQLPPLRRPSQSKHLLLHPSLPLPHNCLEVYHLPLTNVYEFVYCYVSLISVFCLFNSLLVITTHSDTKIFLYHNTLLSGSSFIPSSLR